MDGTAMDALVESVGRKSPIAAVRYVRVATSAAVSGVKEPRETASMEADALPLSERFASSLQRSQGSTEAGPMKGQGKRLVLI